MNGLVAQDAMIDNVVAVSVNDRAGDTERPARGAVCAVFESGSSGAFLGLLAPHQIARASDKNFGELLPDPTPEPVAGGTSLPEVLKRLRVSGVEALPVLDENFRFVGGISQRSILDALLKRERELIKKSREFRQAVQDDKRRRYESVRRLEQVNQAFKKLLGALARPPGMEVFQRGIEALSVVVEASYGAVNLLNESGRYRESIMTGDAPGGTEGTRDFLEQRYIILEQVVRGNRIVKIADVPQYLRKLGVDVRRVTARSFLGVPISREGHVFGCAYVCDKQEGDGFTDDDEVLVASYASGLSLSLAQSREIAQRRRAERERDMLAKLGLRLTTADTLDKVADVVRSLTEEFWEWDAFQLGVRRSGKGKLKTLLEIDHHGQRTDGAIKQLAASGPEQFEVAQNALPEASQEEGTTPPVRGQDALNKLLVSGHAVLINRSAEDPGPDLPRFGDEAKESASMVFAPLRMEGTFVGVISVQSYKPGRFQAGDRKLLQRLAEAVGPALGRCQAELRSAAFSSLGYRLSMATTPEEAARIIVDIADDLIGWDACSVYLYDAGDNICTNVLHMDLVDGERVSVLPAMISSPPGALPRRTIEEGPQLILRQEAKFENDTDPFGDQTRPSASLMFVPLRVGTGVTGILSIQSYALDAYESGDLSLLQALADHCSGALERTRVLQAALRDAQVT
ncbi:MAG: GAF domain-containing protein [Candidatus Sumerlaeaceae bacterium]